MIQLVRAGLGSLFQLPVIQKFAGQTAGRVADVLRSHFCDSSHELGLAFQESYRCAMTALASGLMTESQDGSWLKRLAATARKFREGKVSQEFSCTLQENYFLPFIQQQGWAPDSQEAFRQGTLSLCLQLAKQAENVLPANVFSEPDWAALVQSDFSVEISELLLERTRTVTQVDAYLEGFLRYQGLLGDAVLYFFRENMRQNERVERTLAELQREGLWIELRDLQAAQAQMEYALRTQLTEVSSQIAEFQSRHEFQKLAEFALVAQDLQHRLVQIPQLIQEAHQEWRTWSDRIDLFERRFGSWCEVISIHMAEVLRTLEETSIHAQKARAAAEYAAVKAEEAKHAVSEGVADIRGDIGGIAEDMGGVAERVEALSEQVAALLQWMQGAHLGVRIQARDEFTHHNDKSIAMLREAWDALQAMPRHHREYSTAAMVVGSALSSAGELNRAAQLLEEARSAAKDTAEEALASYNLFQVYLRQGQYDQALEALLHAAQLDRTQYLLFDMDRYIPQQLLGAGGMGCAFLCRDEWEGSLVVVKSFWETRPGSLQEVFREAYLMRDLAGEHIPRPLNRAYAYPGLQKHPFIVMEYIPNTMDGEAWLQQYGKMGLMEGVQVGIQVAEGLAIAHRAGICHLDLKPANILLRRNGNKIEVKIIDFGLARAGISLRQDAARYSHSGKSMFAREIFGTLDYAPPEQLGLLQSAQPGPHSDLFSFGATLYRLMSGENPRTINPLCLPDNHDLYQLLARCMMHDPSKRPSSASEVAQQLRSIARRAPQPSSSTRRIAKTENSPPASPFPLVGNMFQQLQESFKNFQQPFSQIAKLWQRNERADDRVAPDPTDSRRPQHEKFHKLYKPLLGFMFWPALAWIPFFGGLAHVYAGVRAKKKSWWVMGLVYFFLPVILFDEFANTMHQTDIAVFCLLLLPIISGIHARSLRQAYQQARTQLLRDPHGN